MSDVLHELRRILTALLRYGLIGLVVWACVGLLFGLEPPYPLAFRQAGIVGAVLLAFGLTVWDTMDAKGRRGT